MAELGKTAKIKQRWLRGKRIWIHLALGEFRQPNVGLLLLLKALGRDLPMKNRLFMSRLAGSKRIQTKSRELMPRRHETSGGRAFVCPRGLSGLA